MDDRGGFPRGSSKKSLIVSPCVRFLACFFPARVEATTGNGGSGSASTELSICSLGLVICVLDIAAPDLRCVSAISRTRARVYSLFPSRFAPVARVRPSPSAGQRNCLVSLPRQFARKKRKAKGDG